MPTLQDETRAVVVNDLRHADGKKESLSDFMAIVEDRKYKQLVIFTLDIGLTEFPKPSILLV